MAGVWSLLLISSPRLYPAFARAATNFSRATSACPWAALCSFYADFAMSRRIWLSEIRYSSTCLALIAAAFFKSGLSAEVCGDERYSGPISIPITDVLLKQGMSSFGALVRIGTTDVRNFSMELNTYVTSVACSLSQILPAALALCAALTLGIGT